MRSVKPEIIRGDAGYTKSLDGLTAKYGVQVTSGVIAFRDNENITDKQMEKLLDDFENSFIGSDMRDKVNVLYVEHWDKGNREVHFVANNVAILDDGRTRYFNPFPPGHEKLANAFVALKNDEFGFEQVVEKKVLKTEYTGEERKALRSGHHNFKDLDNKARFDKSMKHLVLTGEIKNRKELIEHLEQEGYQFSRIGNDYISLKNEHGRNMRLRGGIYAHNNGLDYEVTIANEKEKKKPFSHEEALSSYNSAMEKRATFNAKRYDAQDNPKSYQPEPRKEPVADKAPMDLPSSQPIQENRSQEGFEPLEHQQDVSSTQGPVLSGSASANLEKALAQFNNARTPQETARAQMAVASAKIAVMREAAENEERLKRSYAVLKPL